ncbi:MAG: hypothetical protein WAY93_09620 [Atopobiaceae bacterium]|jgi:hypothetical protein
MADESPSVKQLLDFLETAICAEAQIYELETAQRNMKVIIEAIESRMSGRTKPLESYIPSASVGIDDTMRLEPYPEYHEGPLPSKNMYVHDDASGSSGCLGSVVGAILGFLSCYFIGLRDTMMHGFDVGYVLSITLRGAVIGFLALFLAKKLKHSNEVSSYEDALRKAQAEEAERKAAYDERIQELRDSDEALVDVIRSRMLSLDVLIAKCREPLRNLYENGPIYEDYQNLPALCQLRQYLRSGICSELTGPDGAYRTYEIDKGMNRINTNLVAICSRLESIQQSQEKLYETLSNVNDNLKSLNTGVEGCVRLVDSMGMQNELQTYYAKKAAEDANVLKRIEVYNRKWLNLPPGVFPWDAYR